MQTGKERETHRLARELGDPEVVDERELPAVRRPRQQQLQLAAEQVLAPVAQHLRTTATRV